MAEKGFSRDIQAGRLRLPKARQITGTLEAGDLRIGLVISRFNSSLTTQLTRSAVDTLKELGAREDRLTLVWVPGAYEIPFVIHRLARSGRFDVLLALGVVIQGETPHAGLINQQVALSLAAIAREQNIPVLDGVVTALSLDQATARCDPARANRGRYVATAAVEMAQVFKRVEAELA